MEKQLENSTQNQDKPTGKPNSKSIKTQGETQPKNNPNPLENPAQTILNGTWKAQQSRICRSIYYRWVFHCCHRIFHCCRRLGVGGEGSVVEERGRAKVRGRLNQWKAEAAAAATAGWVRRLWEESEGNRELGERVETKNVKWK